MKRTTKIAAAIAAGSALLVGGTAAVTAAIVDGTNDRPVQAQIAAGYGPMRHGSAQQGSMQHGSMQQGQRGQQGPMARQAMPDGSMRHARGGQQAAITAQSGTLTQEQKTKLAYM